MDKNVVPRWLKEDAKRFVCPTPNKKCTKCIYYKDEMMYPKCKLSKWITNEYDYALQKS